ncbi:hypothetical protein J4434_07165 [Candidatus Woesearchaeota archaeon]|nr:hypothetical protein [Candidatus Woesearchaeota archaeon]
MKKLYAFLVMAIYLISLVPLAFAQDDNENNGASENTDLDKLMIDIRAFIVETPYNNVDSCVVGVKENFGDENSDFVEDSAKHFCNIWKFGSEDEKTKLDNLVSNIRTLVMQNPHDNIDACVGDVQNVYWAKNAEFVEDTAKHFCIAWATIKETEAEEDEQSDEATAEPSPKPVKDGTAVLPASKFKGKKLGQMVNSVKEDRGALVSRLAKLDKEIRKFVFETEHDNVDACVGDVQNKFWEEPADYVKHFALYHCNIWAIKEAKEDMKEGAEEKVSALKALPAYDLQKAMNVIKLNPELLEKLTSLSEKEKEVMSKYFTRARYKWCLENTEECKNVLKELVKPQVVKRRVIAKEELSESRQRYLRAKEAYKNELEEMRARKARFLELKKLKEEGSTEYSETEMVDTAKDYLLRSIEMLKNHLITIQERVKSSESLTEEEVNEKVKEIEDGLVKLDDLRARVDAATTKEELKVVTEELKDFWKEYRLVTKGQALELMQDKMKDILVRTNVLERKLDQMLQGAELRGIEIPEEVNALINTFSNQIEKARTLYTESRDIKNKAAEIRKEGFDTKEIQEEFNNLIVESNKKLQEARDAVTEAHKTLAEIITKILKVYNGKLPETTPEDIASQAEAEESAEAGVEA